jgi:hypothetical protein
LNNVVGFPLSSLLELFDRQRLCKIAHQIDAAIKVTPLPNGISVTDFTAVRRRKGWLFFRGAICRYWPKADMGSLLQGPSDGSIRRLF